MDKMNVQAILKKAQEVFFRALLAGYASGTEKKDPRLTTTTSMFDFKTINTYRDGDFIVVDEWTKTDDSDVSFGSTTILFEEVPIWFMTYSGLYPKKVIPFLKEALTTQYKTGEFRGGRGPCIFNSKGLTYVNGSSKINGIIDFSCFSGQETIFVQGTKEERGFHVYYGMSMI